jgi:hypothetical protein
VRALAGAGIFTATLPAGPLAGKSGVGSLRTDAPGSRKTESDIPIAAANAAGTMGDRRTAAVFMFE